MGRRLVIDTTVTSAAGGDAATDPISVSCREFLKAVLTICHKFVVTPAIREEWREHRSRFSSTWLTSMDARKKVLRVDAAENEAIQERIDRLSQGNAKAAMLKDMHLVAAARATDGLIVSMDEEVRELFGGISQHIGELRELIWVNPCAEGDQALQWLKDGAESEGDRQLGRQAQE
jgi:hypothetical protein